MPQVVRPSSGPVVVAGPGGFLDDLTSWMVVQAVARANPRDIEVVVVTGNAERWSWLAWTPHAARPCVVAAAGADALPPRRARKRLLVIDHVGEDRWVDAHSADTMVVWRGARADAVPLAAATVITAVSPAHVQIEDAVGFRDRVLADVFAGNVSLRDFGLRVAALGRNRAGDEAPEDTVCLDELVPQVRHADQVVRAWTTSDRDLEIVIGRGADGGGAARVPLVGQNSHALVAGTTGSGKSRLLETITCGLAAAHPPRALNVLVVDFKGGNELAALARLPHCVGFVSDREPTQVDRAITALTREVARRDAAFASLGATDFHDYHRKGGPSMARLVVIADEFGQFRRDDEHGSHVAALLRIATQGRSKGVHLILATQSASTDVTPDIRQNVGVRLCLRVAEPAESVAVLGVPAAAALPRIPGRVLVAAGDDIYEAQVATSRATRAAPDDPVVVRDLLEVATAKPVSDGRADAGVLDETVDVIAKAAALLGDVAPPLLTPPLPEQIRRGDLPGADRPWTTGGLVLGIRDRPGVLAAAPFAFDPFRDGSLTVVGGPRSGRTTALLAVAEAADAQAHRGHPMVVHGIDWARHELGVLDQRGSGGGVVRARDFEHLRRLFRWLAGPGVAGTARIVLIDRFDSLLSDLRDADSALARDLVEILAAGPARGVFPVVTVDPSALLAGSGASLAGARLVLRVDDPVLATAAGVARRAGVAGRGVALPEGDEVQLGQPSDERRRGGAPMGRVAPMPDRVRATDLVPGTGEVVPLGIGGHTTLGPVSVDLDQVGPLVAVVGRARSGRTTLLDHIAVTYSGRRHLVRLSSRHTPEWDPSQPPALVLADDAARIVTKYPWLAAPDLADELDGRGHVLIAAFEQSELNSLGFGHWLMRRPCAGVLLALDPTPDRIVAGERLGFHPPAELRAGPPGRGWWCDRRGAVALQVAAGA